ncbi:MAG: TraR/DksA family transcriptional regulator [Planctomycetota bacterium]
MAKQSKPSRSGPKKGTGASKPSARIKSDDSGISAKAGRSGSAGRKSAKTSAKSATKTKTASKTKSATVTGKKRSATKKPGNNGLLPKVPVKPMKLHRTGKLRKTRLKPEELEEFRQLLIEKRREVVGDVNHLHSEAAHQGSSGETNSGSTMPIHMADIGSDTWEQELTMGLIENEQTLIREIDEALQRIEDMTYGICLATNRPITKSRLRAKPWAKYCIEYARQRELGLI